MPSNSDFLSAGLFQNCLSFGITFALFLLLVYYIKHKKLSLDDASIVISIFFCLILLFTCFMTSLNIYKIKVTPELYIYEQTLLYQNKHK